MKIGIIAAMSDEREQLSKLLDGLREEQVGLFRYVIGELGGNTLYIMECGIGKVNAAVGACEFIMRVRPDVIVSTGVAGGIDEGVGVMDVVAASEVVYHDVWCGMGNAYGQVQGLPPRFTCDARLVRAAASLPSPVPVHVGLICSGDKFVTALSELEDIKVGESFKSVFLNQYGYLFDYVDEDDNDPDWSVRPNMIFAVALDYSPLTLPEKKAIFDICTKELLTPKGLRTLSPKSGGYNPMYVGSQMQRDYAYHQGTAWPWLAGFYMEACLRLYKQSRVSFVERVLGGFEEEMFYHCLGTLPELFDGNPPFHGRGAISYAMNVAEILRVVKLVEKYII